MNRREAFKKIGFTTGLVVLTPSMMRLFQSCAQPAATWTPVFLTSDQGVVLKGLVDTFIPKSDTPSASEVKVPEFIDKYYDQVLDREEQETTKVAYNTLVQELKTRYNEDVGKITTENYAELLDSYIGKAGFDKTSPEYMVLSDLLGSLKWMTINAYRISETVGETILGYDPVPGGYYCDDLEKLTGGKAWSL